MEGNFIIDSLEKIRRDGYLAAKIFTNYGKEYTVLFKVIKTINRWECCEFEYTKLAQESRDINKYNIKINFDDYFSDYSDFIKDVKDFAQNYYFKFEAVYQEIIPQIVNYYAKNNKKFECFLFRATNIDFGENYVMFNNIYPGDIKTIVDTSDISDVCYKYSFHTPVNSVYINPNNVTEIIPLTPDIAFCEDKLISSLIEYIEENAS